VHFIITSFWRACKGFFEKEGEFFAAGRQKTLSLHPGGPARKKWFHGKSALKPLYGTPCSICSACLLHGSLVQPAKTERNSFPQKPCFKENIRASNSWLYYPTWLMGKQVGFMRFPPYSNRKSVI
jgi:hypothetical protein